MLWRSWWSQQMYIHIYYMYIFLDGMNLAHEAFLVHVLGWGEIQRDATGRRTFGATSFHQPGGSNRLNRVTMGCSNNYANSWIPWPGASNHCSRRQEQQEAPSGNLWGFWDFWDSKNFAEQSSWVLSIYYNHQYRTIILIVIVIIINISCCHYCWLLYSLVSGMSRRDSKTCRSSFFNEHFSKEPRRTWSFQHGSMFHVSSPAVFVNAEVQGAFCSLHR